MLWNLLPALELLLLLLFRVMGATLMFLCQVSFSFYTSLKCSGVGRQEDAFLTEYFVAVEKFFLICDRCWHKVLATQSWEKPALIMPVSCHQMLRASVIPSKSIQLVNHNLSEVAFIFQIPVISILYFWFLLLHLV